MKKTKYTWAIKWNVSNLPSEELCAMNKWNMASSLLYLGSGGFENIYFDSERDCCAWLKIYIENVIRDNQEYAAIAIKAKYRIFELTPVFTDEIE